MAFTKECAAVFLVATAVFVVRECAGSSSSSQLEVCNFTSPHFSPAVIANIQQILKQEILRQRHLGESREYAATSCEEIREIRPCKIPGVYWVQGEHGTNRSYCSRDGRKKVADVDMQVNTQCPSGLEMMINETKRLCRRPEVSRGCSSVTFSVGGTVYSTVHGRVRGYQYNTPNAFNHSGAIDGTYVDGVSITHGSNPRTHIWTLAAGYHETSTNQNYQCPCVDSRASSLVPSFVENDYYCDIATQNSAARLFPNALWDGEGCGPTSRCCDNPNLPWFIKELDQPTTDDIELRVCRDQDRANEDVLLEIIEIYIE